MREGQEIIIRCPVIEDAPVMLGYINALSTEQTFLLFQGTQLTLEQEIEFVEGRVKAIAEKKAVMGLLFIDGVLAGISGIDQKPFAESPQGNFGISIAADFRGQGLGKLLMDVVVREAEKQMDIAVITLACFANNTVACEMYKKYGFIEVGRTPKAILHKNQLIDSISMYKEVVK